MSTLSQAMQASVSFRLTNTDSTKDRRVAIIPAHFRHEAAIFTAANGSDPARVDISYANPAHIVSAGYACDEVVADALPATVAEKNGQKVAVADLDNCAYSDFLNMLTLRPSCRIVRIEMQNHTNSQAIFDQKFEVRQTSLGTVSGADFIRLQQFVSVNAYDRTKIVIDLEQAQLLANAKTLMFLNIPAGADFTITFYVVDDAQ